MMGSNGRVTCMALGDLLPLSSSMRRIIPSSVNAEETPMAKHSALGSKAPPEDIGMPLIHPAERRRADLRALFMYALRNTTPAVILSAIVSQRGFTAIRNPSWLDITLLDFGV